MTKKLRERLQTKTRHDLPALHSREIGRLIVKWAYLERYLTSIAYLMLDIPASAGRLAVIDPPALQRLQLIVDLAYVYEVKLDLKQIKQIQKTIGQIVEIRDLLAHGIWAYSEKDKKWFLQQTRGAWNENPDGPEGTSTAAKKKIGPEGLLVDLNTLKWHVRDVERLIGLVQALKEQIEPQLSA